MNLSYPKALRILPQPRRRSRPAGRGSSQGSSERGGAELTPFGRDFIRRFDRTQEKIRRFAIAAFEKEFSRRLSALKSSLEH